LRNGIVDAYTHVLEQYMTYPANAWLQDRFAESILQTLIEVAPKILADPSNYEAAASFMWSCTMALNGLIQKGVPTDWATHMIGHELTALYNIDHAMTLAIIFPNLYRNRFDNKKKNWRNTVSECGILPKVLPKKSPCRYRTYSGLVA
jgi:NADP-dependent alcohol dehydrogenase